MIKNMMTLKSLLACVSVLGMLLVSPHSYAVNPVTVQAWAVHYAGNIQYNYRVTNNTRARTIATVSIGNQGDNVFDTVPTYDPPNLSLLNPPELTDYPLGSYWSTPNPTGDQRGWQLRLGGTFVSPPGWSGKIQNYEFTDRVSVDWNGISQPGTTNTFSVTLPSVATERASATLWATAGEDHYLQGHFTVRFHTSTDISEGPARWDYTAPIVSLDTVPPALSVTLTPATLTTAQRGKLVPITATITVSDNYDPAPDIQLVSITANEVLSASDVQSATLGTNDRSFSLMAAHKTKTTTARVYTVTYSATDASGNKSLATATVSAL